MPSTNGIDTTGAIAAHAPRERMARACVRERGMRETLQRLARDDPRQGRRYQRQYLHGLDSMLAALHEANKKARFGLPVAELVTLAVELSAWLGTDESASMWPKGKADGYRPVTEFGVRNVTLQILAHRAAAPFIHPHPCQYAAAGNGSVEVACQRILKLLRGGFTWVLVADTEGNFNSMRRAGVIEMIPLPEKMIRAVVLADGLNINPTAPRGSGGESERRCNTREKAEAGEGTIRRVADATKATRHPMGLPQGGAPLPKDIACARQRGSQRIKRGRADEALKKGRQGLPQGSACSSLFSGCLHEPVVRTISELAPVVHFDDNYFIFAKTREGLLPIAQTLRAEFSRHPAGPLLFSKCIIKDARRGFVALGYIFKVKDGRAWLRPPHQKLERCYLKFLGMIDDVDFGTATPDAARQYLRGWCAAARIWPHVGLWERLLLARMDRLYPPPTEVDRAGAGRRCPL